MENLFLSFREREGNCERDGEKKRENERSRVRDEMSYMETFVYQRLCTNLALVFNIRFSIDKYLRFS